MFTDELREVSSRMINSIEGHRSISHKSAHYNHKRYISRPNVITEVKGHETISGPMFERETGFFFLCMI
jgi:hypothetical protein